jgi:branched-chain amino acid transport system permease protein
VNTVIESAITEIWGADIKVEPQPFGGQSFTVSGLSVQYNQVLIFVVGIAVVALLSIFFRATNMGLAARATATDRLWPQYVGVNVLRVLSMSWVLAGGLGALAGIFVAGQFYLDALVMDTLLLAAFTAAAIGGFESLWGAYVGGLVVGLAQDWGAAYIASNSTQWIVFVVLFVVLMVRPTGLGGKKHLRRV